MENFTLVAANTQNPKWKNMNTRLFPLYNKSNEIRSNFERDYNRIIYCNAYRRLKHKTQVFYSPKNDHICTRIEHVNNVEATSYTIAKALGFSTTLTRAISIGHDIGHSPFGHQGEKNLSSILEEATGETFWHEKNGLTFVDQIELLEDNEDNKQTLNLTYAVRDGIISHCGEIDENGLKPREEYIDLNNYSFPNAYAPYTWEGCVVKVSDKISYLGRDIKDAISLGLLDKNLDELYDVLQYPKNKKINNTNIITDLIYDLCQNSSIEKGLCFSNETFQKLQLLKKFNYTHIYLNERLKPSIAYFNLVLRQMYQLFKSAYSKQDTKKALLHLSKYYPTIMIDFLNWLEDYWDLNTNREHLKNNVLYHMDNEKDYDKAIITYISGMTDNYAIETYNEIIRF